MKKLLLFLLINTIYLQSFAQEHAWVYFEDKPNETSYLASPLTMLSQRALDRRVTQNIALDVKDVPIEVTYYNQINTATGITILSKSKWLNAVHVFGEVDDIDNLITTFTFVESIEFANNNLNSTRLSVSRALTIEHQDKFESILTDYDYGDAANQIEMLKGDVLHELNFTGDNMQIAVIDAGFPNVNTLAAFSRIRDNDQILGGYDFVDRTDDFYAGHNHGTNVLSDIAGYIEGEFVGTAPDASFYLFRTEDAANETPLEESLWVEAAERADSLGVDVINTSLGYTTFDNSNYDYSYADMNGETTFITRGAEIGASRGMLLVNSAGNSGNSSWTYIGAPADAPSVFSIGAVNTSENIASFSSFGPTSDGRVKPDVLAQGQNVYVLDYVTGNPVTSNGTSFSSPVLAGVITCFWQAFPEKTNMEVMQIIRESSDRYTSPTDQHGYGIPDFELAYNASLSVEQNLLNTINIYPNSVENVFYIEAFSNNLENYSLSIYDVLGKKIFEVDKVVSNEFDVTYIKQGMYFVKISFENQQKIFKLIKE